ncbi:unnamed protein product [Coregonus sp. 'balchen']|nr:unnamed protein product [Coregonus sp. 'balchen']
MATAQSALTFAVCILMITELILAKKDYYDILGVRKDANEPYETLSDEKRRQEYDQFGHGTFYNDGTKDQNGPNIHQPFNFNDVFKDFDIYSQNRHTHHQRHFEDHFRTHQEAHHNRHKRHFQGAFGAAGGGGFDDMFDDMEKMFTFDRDTTKRTESTFQGTTTKQHCRTVTQRRGEHGHHVH